MSVVDLGYLQKTLESERFWGEVEVKFQDGQIVLVKKVETFKPIEYVRMFRVELKNVGV